MTSKEQFEATVTSKGQITIPLPVRDRLGLKPGDHVQFLFEEGQTVIRPARGKANPFRRWMGAWKSAGFQSVDDVKAWVADLRDDEQ